MTNQVGETPQIRITYRDQNTVLVNPTTVKIYIRKPDGKPDVDGVDMTNESTGIYYYNYTIDSDIGTYDIKIVATGDIGSVIHTYILKAVGSFK